MMALKLQDGAVLFDGDLNSIIQGLSSLEGISLGLATTATGSPDMQTHVASGRYRANGTEVVKASTTNLTHDTADPIYKRYDIIVGDSAGTLSIVKGTAAATPAVPDTPDTKCRIAIIEIPASDTSIEQAQIKDARIIINDYKKWVYADFMNGKTASTNFASSFTAWVTPVPPYNLQTITYDFSRLPTGSEVYFEAVAYGPGYNDTLKIRLYNQTDSTVPSGGELEFQPQSWALHTSANLYSVLSALTEKTFSVQAYQTTNTNTNVMVSMIRFRILVPY